MEHDMKGIVPEPRIAGATPPDAHRCGEPPCTGDGGFEALLREVCREVETLKEGTRTLHRNEKHVRPESLQGLLVEADRNYETAVTAGKALLRAYRTLLPEYDGSHGPDRATF